jgi:hypothetical protein
MKSVRFCLAVCLALSLLFSFSTPTRAEPSPEGFEWAIEPRFDDTLPFAANGLAGVKVKYKWGYIDEKGKEVTPPRFDLAWPFAADGLAPVAVEGKWGFIDEKGKEVIPLRFDVVWYFAANGLALVRV